MTALASALLPQTTMSRHPQAGVTTLWLKGVQGSVRCFGKGGALGGAYFGAWATAGDLKKGLRIRGIAWIGCCQEAKSF